MHGSYRAIRAADGLRYYSTGTDVEALVASFPALSFIDPNPRTPMQRVAFASLATTASFHTGRICGKRAGVCKSNSGTRRNHNQGRSVSRAGTRCHRIIHQLGRYTFRSGCGIRDIVHPAHRNARRAANRAGESCRSIHAPGNNRCRPASGRPRGANYCRVAICTRKSG